MRAFPYSAPRRKERLVVFTIIDHHTTPSHARISLSKFAKNVVGQWKTRSGDALCIELNMHRVRQATTLSKAMQESSPVLRAS